MAKEISEYERFLALSDAEKDAEVARYGRPEGVVGKPLTAAEKALHRLARVKGRGGRSKRGSGLKHE